jgi:hypothetical protein
MNLDDFYLVTGDTPGSRKPVAPGRSDHRNSRSQTATAKRSTYLKIHDRDSYESTTLPPRDGSHDLTIQLFY